MNLILIIAGIIIWGWLAFIWIRRYRARRAFEKLSITPEALHNLVATNHNVQILDVRQPLDLLVDSEIIEGALRLSPRMPRGTHPSFRRTKNWSSTAPVPVTKPAAPWPPERRR